MNLMSTYPIITHTLSVFNRFFFIFNDFLEEIKRCNGLSSDTIYAGNHIIVPVVIHSEKIEHP